MISQNNIIKREKLRKIQADALNIIAESLQTSFGPFGCNSIIPSKISAESTRYLIVDYTKDGNDILKSIQFDGIVEMSIKNELLSITDYNLSKVGDSTTSAIILSKFIFDEFIKFEKEHPEIPKQLVIDIVNKIIDKAKKYIMDSANEFDVDKAYKIAYTSTNANEELALIIKKIYEDYGNDVYVDILEANDRVTRVLEYKGMQLECGFHTTAYINRETGEAIIRDPEVYAFADPIDTPLMGNLLDAIIKRNIIDPAMDANNNKSEPKYTPTVIFAPKISRDFAPLLKRLSDTMYGTKALESKPPLLLVTNIYDDQFEKYDDIAKLCGCKPIMKYIDPEIYKTDSEKGIAPTINNIYEFAGKCEQITSTSQRTVVYNPSDMYDENGNQTDTYKNLLAFAQANLDKIKHETNNIHTIYKAKRRLNSLKMNLIELYIGGISIGEREARRALLEDAVLNCRSASQNGVGLGSNLESFKALDKIIKDYKEDSDSLEYKVVNIFHTCVTKLIKLLYSTAGEEFTDKKIEHIMKYNQAYDLRNKEFNDMVISSIETDAVVLEGTFKIISLIFNASQFICPDVSDNWYPDNKED